MFARALLVLLLLAPLPATAGEIHRAIETGDAAQVARLLAQDPSFVSLADENPTEDLPLHTAATTGSVEIARLLLDAGAAIDGGDVDGSTALGVAALRGHEALVRFLLERGADVNRRDRNGAYALSFAISGRDPAIAELILEAGADLHYRPAGGANLLHLACYRNADALCRILLERGVDPRAVDEEGQTPLHAAGMRGNGGMVEQLLAGGADPDPVDENGQSPLMFLAFEGQVEAARLLVEAGADPNRQDVNGNTALHMACWRNQAAYARFLLEQGARPDPVAQQGDVPLLLAAERGSVRIVDALLTTGAPVDVVHSRHGVTALHLAALNGYSDVVDRLLESGAAVDPEGPRGVTPLCLARRYGHQAVARCLERRGGHGGGELDRPRCDIPASDQLATGELVVRYLGHSGYAVQTRDHLLVFDYAPGQERLPDEPSILNGHIVPEELQGRKVVFFVSHVHGDHFDPVIFELQQRLPDATCVLGFTPQTPVPVHEFVGPRQERQIGEMKVSTIASNDSGVGFVVQVDGVTVFHAGDHANRERDFSGNYMAEIEYLAPRHPSPDVVFLPISGCNFGDLEAVRLGVHRTLEVLQPVVFIPMHAGNDASRYRDFLEACQPAFPGVRMVAPEAKGDAFHYREGSIG